MHFIISAREFPSRHAMCYLLWGSYETGFRTEIGSPIVHLSGKHYVPPSGTLTQLSTVGQERQDNTGRILADLPPWPILASRDLATNDYLPIDVLLSGSVH